jgi:kynurenine formamidase
VHRFALALFVSLLGTACRLPGSAPEESVIDLSYPFDADTVYWPTAEPFHLEAVFHGTTEAGFHYEANSFSAAEHGGTHLDAPCHFAEGQLTVDAIPLDDLIGPGIVVDVTEACASDRDHRVTIAELEAWEHEYQQIPPGTIVLLRTGFGRFWPDRERYMGTAARGQEAVADLHFPGLDGEAARWLVEERHIRAVGLDTASIDCGQSRTFDAHRVLAAANVPILENVAQLDQLPPGGFFVMALPMKIRGGSGGPVRIAALVR